MAQRMQGCPPLSQGAHRPRTQGPLPRMAPFPARRRRQFGSPPKCLPRDHAGQCPPSKNQWCPHQALPSLPRRDGKEGTRNIPRVLEGIRPPNKRRRSHRSRSPRKHRQAPPFRIFRPRTRRTNRPRGLCCPHARGTKGNPLPLWPQSRGHRVRTLPRGPQGPPPRSPYPHRTRG